MEFHIHVKGNKTLCGRLLRDSYFIDVSLWTKSSSSIKCDVCMRKYKIREKWYNFVIVIKGLFCGRSKS
jgi:hypothetical protein